ncbi:hypothetical protein BKA69DRAFT_1171554 [Paraphysoderma sedebokerense]|nr:hypothetical protein BKA69DRAFT_1171554 [Paraphysoderma sedebokerense]
MKFVSVILFALLAASDAALYKRRFGNENSPQAQAVFQKIRNSCQGTQQFPGQCDTLAGQSISSLLAAADKCAQQDMADQMVDLAKKLDNGKTADLIQAAQEFRALERNSNPFINPTGCTALCDRAPRNSELNGIVQGQDPNCPQQPGNAAAPSPQPPQVEAPVDQAPAKPIENGNGNGNGSGNGDGNANGNLNPFAGNLFDVPPVPLTLSGNPARKFEVAGDTFVNFGAACDRSCDRQNNQCANKVNSGGAQGGSVSDCNAQQGECKNVCRDGLAKLVAEGKV